MKACGTHALLCGHAAGHLWRVLKGRPPSPEVMAPSFPKPVVNRLAGGRRVDCRWPEHRLTVELDSYTFHRSRHAWELDRRRERQARARGDEFIRYTYGDVFETPSVVVRELSRVLPRASPSRSRPRAPRPAPR